MCGGSDDKDTSSSSSSNESSSSSSGINTYDNYYDAIDAEGVGATVNIGGNIVSAETADGYQGSGASNIGASNIGASSSDSDVSDYEQAAYGTTQEDFYSNQATTGTGSSDSDSGSTYDEIPTTEQINAASGFFDDDDDYTPTSAELNAQLAANEQVNLTDDQFAQPVDFTTTASGQDYTTAAEADTDESGFQFAADTDSDTGINLAGSTLASDEPVVDIAVDPITGQEVAVQSGVGSLENALAYSQSLLDEPPTYYDTFGNEYSTQEAANTADAEYAAAQQQALDIASMTDGQAGYTVDGNQFAGPDVPAGFVSPSDRDTFDDGTAGYTVGGNQFQGPDVPIPDDAPITYDGNQQLGASGQLDDGRYDFLDDLPDDKFDFVDETEALLAELGVNVDLLGDNTDTGINLESYDDANDFVETPVTDLDKVQDLVDSGVDRSLAQAVVESGVVPGEAAGLDKYDFGNVTELEAANASTTANNTTTDNLSSDIKGKETAPEVITNLALGDGTDDEGYTPTSAELEAQLAEQGLTNITPGPLSVEDQVAQYDTGVNLDTLDAQRQDSNDLSADLAMEGMINTGVLDDTILDLNFDLTDPNEALKNSDGTNFTGQYRGTSYVDGQPVDSGTAIPTDAEINAFRDQEAILAGMSGMNLDGTDTDAENIDLKTTVEGTDTGGAATSTSTTGSGATASEAYLSAVAKISDPNYDPNQSTLTSQEQYALYGARGQTPNAAEAAYLNDLLSDAVHKEDVVNPDTGAVIAKAGDKVTVQSFGEKVEDGIVSFIDTFLNPLSIFGEKFTIGGTNAANVEAQLEAYKNGGTFVYNDEGAVVGVASPNFDASGDGNLDTVVSFDADGNKTVTGDAIAVTDVTTSNNNTDGEEFDIDIVNSTNTYTNPDEAGGDVIVGRPGDDEEQEGGDDDEFIICEEGFEFDPVEGICMPIADIGDGTGTGTGGTTISTDKRDRTDPVIVRPDQPNVGALKVRGAKQFAQGGMVTSNIDNFVQSLRG